MYLESYVYHICYYVDKLLLKVVNYTNQIELYMKVLDEYRTAPMSVSLDFVPFVDKNLRNVMSMSYTCRPL